MVNCKKAILTAVIIKKNWMNLYTIESELEKFSNFVCEYPIDCSYEKYYTVTFLSSVLEQMHVFSIWLHPDLKSFLTFVAVRLKYLFCGGA